MSEEHAFLLQKVQPAMVGLVDGSLSTLAPIFSIALATHDTRYAFIAGLATALGAGISMAFSEGSTTWLGTFVACILHSLPFLIPQYHAALLLAVAVFGFERLLLAYFR